MKFVEKNRKQLFIISVIIVFAIIVTCVWGDFMNWVSIMISVPSFLMSFIVLNQFNVDSDLNLALKAARDEELVQQDKKRRFSEYYDENFKEVQNSLDDIKKYSNSQIKKISKNQISQAMIGNAKKGLEKYKEFVFETQDYVKLSLSSQESAEVIMEHRSPYCMKSRDISTMIEQLDSIDSNYFEELKQSSLGYVSDLSPEQKAKLKEVFLDVESFSKKYLRVVENVYSTVENKEG